jgi:hypothetical protein
VKGVFLDSAAAKGEAHIVWVWKKLGIDKILIGGFLAQQPLLRKPSKDRGYLILRRGVGSFENRHWEPLPTLFGNAPLFLKKGTRLIRFQI